MAYVIFRPFLRFVPALLLLVFSGCDMLDMYDEPRFEPLEASTFFDDGTSARPLVAGTVARGDLREDEGFYSGKVDGKYVTTLPVDLDEQLLLRGQERFNIYCSPCHGRVGDGNGMIVQRGFRRPPSFVSTDRLLNAPLGHFYDVISNGFGAMPSYASRVAPHDRWAIVAYIRALQRSQNGSVEDVPAELRDKIAEAEAVEEQEREKRGAAERLDTERQQKLDRDIREHRRSPEEGERRNREIDRERNRDSGDNKSLSQNSCRAVFEVRGASRPDRACLGQSPPRRHKAGTVACAIRPSGETACFGIGSKQSALGRVSNAICRLSLRERAFFRGAKDDGDALSEAHV